MSSRTVSSNQVIKFFFFLFFFFQPLRDLRIVSFLAFQDIILIISIVFLAHSKTLKFLDYRIPFFTLLSCIFIAITTQQYSLNYSANITNIAKVLIAYGFVSYYVMIFVEEYGNHLRLATYGIISGVSLTLLLSFRDFISNSDNARLIGYSGHANYFAFSGSICFILSLFIEVTSLKFFLIRFVGIAAGLIAVLLTVSNTAIFCLFCGLILRYAGKSYKLLFAPFVALISLLAFENLALFENSRRRLDEAFTQRYSYSVGGLGNNSLQDRIYTAVASLDKLKNNPFFGYGLDVDGRITSTGIETHNYLLLSWQTGGFFFFFFQLVLTFIMCQKMFQRRFDRLFICLFICIFAFLMSEPWIYERSITSLIFLAYFYREK